MTRYLGFAIAAALGAASVHVVQEKTARAERFELVDAAGKVRAELGLTGKGQPSLTFYDREGRGRSTLLLAEAGGGVLMFVDDKGAPRATITEAGVVLRDDSSVRARLAMDAEAGPGLFVHDAKGKVRAGVGPGTMVFLGESGGAEWKAP